MHLASRSIDGQWVHLKRHYLYGGGEESMGVVSHSSFTGQHLKYITLHGDHLVTSGCSSRSTRSFGAKSY